MPTTPAIRVQQCNDAPLNPDGEYVLYWMISARRPQWNFALQHAAGLAAEHGVGLVVLEPLRCDYPWASDRLHHFVIQGMRANAEAFRQTPVRYYPYVERGKGEGKGLIAALGARAVAVVTDEFPCFFLPRMVAAGAKRLDVRLEQVDGNGLYPLRAADREFTVAHSFRRHLQKNLRPHLEAFPGRDPLRGRDLPEARVPREVLDRWGEALPGELSGLPIDHDVTPVAYEGGWRAGGNVVERFVGERLGFYDERNHPDEEAASGLSPWLHFGHVSPHQVFRAVADREGWDIDNLAEKANGKRTGWWGMGENAESFLDELVTWRELGFQWCHRHPADYHRFETLPDFALKTLRAHAGDRREHVYTLERFEAAQTHDEVWNAAQRQLLAEGRIHNYLRMLWGKKVLHWTPGPERALEIMIELNNRYAVDGRDPNSYSGIMWCLGRFDRAWGPERPVFGKVRYMTSKSTRAKCRMEDYLARYGS